MDHNQVADYWWRHTDELRRIIKQNDPDAKLGGEPEEILGVDDIEPEERNPILENFKLLDWITRLEK